MTPEQRSQARDRCLSATPGPHQTRFIFRMINAVRKNQSLLGLMMDPDSSHDWADADLWANAQADLTMALEDLAAAELKIKVKEVEVEELERKIKQLYSEMEARS